MGRHLMAKFRHLRDAGNEHGLNLDWKPAQHGKFPAFEAEIENGDHISMLGAPTRKRGRPRGAMSWSYAIFGPSVPWDDSGKLWFGDRRNNGRVREWLTAGGGHVPPEEGGSVQSETSPYYGKSRPTYFEDHVEAMRAAEEHYFSLGRHGQGPSGMDSGVDYDDILRNYRDYL